MFTNVGFTLKGKLNKHYVCQTRPLDEDLFPLGGKRCIFLLFPSLIPYFYVGYHEISKEKGKFFSMFNKKKIGHSIRKSRTTKHLSSF